MEESDRPTLSQTAIDALRAELDELKGEGRRQMSERLLAARELGDVSDNADFESAKQDQSLLETRIARLEQLLKHAVAREAPTDATTVAPGLVVNVRDIDAPDFEESYLVADAEERITGVQVLSPSSPLGQVLLGKHVGDKVTYQAPGGTFTYEILEIRPHD